MKGSVWAQFWSTQCSSHQQWPKYTLVQKIPMNPNNLLLYYKISSVYNTNKKFANCKHCKSTVALENLGGFLLPPLIKTLHSELSWWLGANVWTGKEPRSPPRDMTCTGTASDKSPSPKDRSRFGQVPTCQVSYIECEIQTDSLLMFTGRGMLLPANSLGTVYLCHWKERMLLQFIFLTKTVLWAKISKIALKYQARKWVNINH